MGHRSPNLCWVPEISKLPIIMFLGLLRNGTGIGSVWLQPLRHAQLHGFDIRSQHLHLDCLNMSSLLR